MLLVLVLVLETLVLPLPPAAADSATKCRDFTLCTTFDSCTDRNALFRSGHLCHG